MPDDLMSSPTALATQDPPRASALMQHGIVPRSYDDIWRLAKATCLGGLAPRYENQPARVAAVMMCGMEIGLKPMSALRLMYQTPDGQPALMVRGMLAIVQGSGLLAYWSDHIDGDGDARTCTITCERRGQPRFTRSFSVAEAKRAQLTGKRGDMYSKWTDRMIFARAASFALNDGFADLLGGLYDPSELGGPVIDEDGREILPPCAPAAPDVPPDVPPAPAAPAPERAEKAAIERFWLKSSLNLCQASTTPNDLIAKLLRAIPLAPSLTMLERLMADQTADILRLAMTADEWDAVESARFSRWEVLVQESETEEEAGADGNMAP
jgi:hypothetical protein